MKLSETVNQYITYKQSIGMRFCTEARTLKSFCRAMGDIAIEDVDPLEVLAFIAGTGPVTRFWHKKRDVLFGFYRFAMSRGYAATSPLPTVVPKPPQAFTPYIYSREEIGRLLQAADVCENSRGSIQTHTGRPRARGRRSGRAGRCTFRDSALPTPALWPRSPVALRLLMAPS